MNVFHLSTRKFSKYFISFQDFDQLIRRMVDEAITSAIKLKSLEALHFIEAKCQLNEGNTNRIRQAREKLQDNDDNPLKNVFKMFNRGPRADE